MIDLMLPLPGLSSVSGKTVVAKFDGGLLSSDGGILVLREIEQRLRVADRLAACIQDTLRWHRPLPWIAKGAALNRPAESSSPRGAP